jgi:hypothetical protein
LKITINHHREVKNTDLSRIKITNHNFEDVTFIDCHFYKCLFHNCNFSGAKFFKSSFEGTMFPNCIVKNIDFKEVGDIVRSRLLIGELLRQEAGDSHEKKKFASFIANDAQLCFKDWIKIASDNRAILLWIVFVFKKHPDAKLYEALLDVLDSSKILNNLEHKRVLHNHFAILETNNGDYVGITQGYNQLSKGQVIGKLDSYCLDKKYSDNAPQFVDIYYTPDDKNLGTEIEGLKWPSLMPNHSSTELISDEFTNIYLTFLNRVEEELQKLAHSFGLVKFQLTGNPTIDSIHKELEPKLTGKGINTFYLFPDFCDYSYSVSSITNFLEIFSKAKSNDFFLITGVLPLIFDYHLLYKKSIKFHQFTLNQDNYWSSFILFQKI